MIDVLRIALPVQGMVYSQLRDLASLPPLLKGLICEDHQESLSFAIASVLYEVYGNLHDNFVELLRGHIPVPESNGSGHEKYVCYMDRLLADHSWPTDSIASRMIMDYVNRPYLPGITECISPHAFSSSADKSLYIGDFNLANAIHTQMLLSKQEFVKSISSLESRISLQESECYRTAVETVLLEIDMVVIQPLEDIHPGLKLNQSDDYIVSVMSEYSWPEDNLLQRMLKNVR
ncbi:hypothetical protein ACIP6T_10985 [Pantoea sp. NPDC088449]|uniref:hypothetical protein n=1 Tax=Pantoea sp. NPDC088449 TaxID=3364392 RepID=UPI0037F1BBC9